MQGIGDREVEGDIVVHHRCQTAFEIRDRQGVRASKAVLTVGRIEGAHRNDEAKALRLTSRRGHISAYLNVRILDR